MLPLRAFFITLLLIIPCLAQAHIPEEGIINLYYGFLHPVKVAAHLLAIVVFGLLIGQQGLQALRSALPVFLIALLGGLTIVVFDITFNAELTLLLVSAALGILVAMQRRIPVPAGIILAVLLGLTIGLDSPQDELEGLSKFYALMGTGIGAILCLVLTSGLALVFKKPWQRIVIRVFGSWGTASAVLVLATLFIAEQNPPLLPEDEISGDTITIIINKKEDRP